MGNFDFFSDVALIVGVYLPMLIWLLVMGRFVWILIKKYPLGNWGRDNENPYKTETMGLPRGLIRGILTLTLLIGAVLLQLYAIRFLESEEKISTFMSAFEIMLAFYFGSKVMHHLSSVDKNKAKSYADATRTKPEEFDDPEAIG